jgi:hypothetical protein
MTPAQIQARVDARHAALVLALLHWAPDADGLTVPMLACAAQLAPRDVNRALRVLARAGLTQRALRDRYVDVATPMVPTGGKRLLREAVFFALDKPLPGVGYFSRSDDHGGSP